MAKRSNAQGKAAAKSPGLSSKSNKGVKKKTKLDKQHKSKTPQAKQQPEAAAAAGAAARPGGAGAASGRKPAAIAAKNRKKWKVLHMKKKMWKKLRQQQEQGQQQGPAHEEAAVAAAAPSAVAQQPAAPPKPTKQQQKPNKTTQTKQPAQVGKKPQQQQQQQQPGGAVAPAPAEAQPSVQGAAPRRKVVVKRKAQAAPQHAAAPLSHPSAAVPQPPSPSPLPLSRGQEVLAGPQPQQPTASPAAPDPERQGEAGERRGAKRRKLQPAAGLPRHAEQLEAGRTLFAFDTNSLMGKHRSALAQAWEAVQAGGGQRVQVLVPLKVLLEVRSKATLPGAAAKGKGKARAKGGSAGTKAAKPVHMSATRALSLLQRMMPHHRCCRVQREDEVFRKLPVPLASQRGDDAILDSLMWFSSLGAQVVLVTQDKGFTRRAGEHGLRCCTPEAVVGAVQEALGTAGAATNQGSSGESDDEAVGLTVQEPPDNAQALAAHTAGTAAAPNAPLAAWQAAQAQGAAGATLYAAGGSPLALAAQHVAAATAMHTGLPMWPLPGFPAQMVQQQQQGFGLPMPGMQQAMAGQVWAGPGVQLVPAMAPLFALPMAHQPHAWGSGLPPGHQAATSAVGVELHHANRPPQSLPPPQQQAQQQQAQQQVHQQRAEQQPGQTSPAPRRHKGRQQLHCASGSGQNISRDGGVGAAAAEEGALGAGQPQHEVDGTSEEAEADHQQHLAVKKRGKKRRLEQKEDAGPSDKSEGEGGIDAQTLARVRPLVLGALRGLPGQRGTLHQVQRAIASWPSLSCWLTAALEGKVGAHSRWRVAAKQLLLSPSVAQVVPGASGKSAKTYQLAPCTLDMG